MKKPRLDFVGSCASRMALAALIAGLAAWTAGPAGASLILQDQFSQLNQVYENQRIGQSFTAEDAHILSIGFRFEPINPDHASAEPLTITLHEGAGFAVLLSALPRSIRLLASLALRMRISAPCCSRSGPSTPLRSARSPPAPIGGFGRSCGPTCPTTRTRAASCTCGDSRVPVPT